MILKIVLCTLEKCPLSNSFDRRNHCSHPLFFSALFFYQIVISFATLALNPTLSAERDLSTGGVTP